MSGVRPRVSAAILAGGRARRFGGTDKAALRLGAARVIDRQLAALSVVADDIAIVSNDPSRYAALQLPVFPDAIPGAGALGGVYTALVHARRDFVLIVACDLPFVSAALFERLIDEMSDEISGEHDAVIPRSARGLEPLCALYHRRCAAAARARIDRGDLQVSELAREIRVRELGAEALAAYDPDERLFVNINTPHDYARARAWIEGNREPPQNPITD